MSLTANGIEIHSSLEQPVEVTRAPLGVLDTVTGRSAL